MAKIRRYLQWVSAFIFLVKYPIFNKVKILSGSLAQIVNQYQRHPRNLQRALVLAVIAIVSFIAADTCSVALDSLFLADLPIPQATPYYMSASYSLDSRDSRLGATADESMVSEDHMLVHNIFHSRGLIPPDLNANRQPILTRLPIEVVGILALAKRTFSTAVIHNKSEQQYFSVQEGDSFSVGSFGQSGGQYRILAILQDKVYFESATDGRVEYALIQGLEPGQELDTPNFQNPTDLTENNRLSAIAKPVSQSRWDHALKNLPETLQQAYMVPHLEKGKQVGFRFVNLDQGSIFEDLGFRAGDVLLEVNGQKLDSMAKVSSLVGGLQQLKTAQVKVKRDGQVVPLNLRVQ